MILALDPSLSSTGYAVLDYDYNLIDCGKITTKKGKIPKGDRIADLEDEDNRIYTIVNGIEKQVLSKVEIDVVVAEAQFGGNNIKTAMQLSRVRGAFIYLFKSKGLKQNYQEPSLVRKNLMGKGNASKEEVAEFIREFYKDNAMVEALGEFNDRPNKNKNSDIYDAIGIGIAYLNSLKGGKDNGNI